MSKVWMNNTEFSSSRIVTKDHFGGNVIFTKNINPESREAFTGTVNDLGIQNLRYPGGTVTELLFDVKNPDVAKDGSVAMGLSNYIEWVESNNKKFTFVMPTAPLFDRDNAEDIDRFIDEESIAATKNFVRELITGKYGDTQNSLKAIEIGNEYFSGAELTTREYGRAANAIIEAIKEVYNELKIPPSQQVDILVQMGSPFAQELNYEYVRSSLPSISEYLGDWNLSFLKNSNNQLSWMDKILVSNALVLDELSPSARGEIDGLVQHYYYSGDSIGNYGGADFTFIDTMFSQWRENGFEDVDLVLTEWNVKNSNTSAGGLKSAGIFVDQFEAMIFHNVSEAYAWPIQENSSNDLGGRVGDTDFISPTGAAFYLMNSLLPGMHLTQTPTQLGQVDASMFSDGQNSLAIIASEANYTQSVTVHLGPVSGANALRVYTIAVDLTTSDGQHWINGGFASAPYYLEHDVGATIEVSSEYILQSDNTITIQLDPYEIAFIETSQSSAPLDDFVEDVTRPWIYGTKNSDRLLSGSDSDHIAGLAGNDMILSGAGDDLVFGHYGDDYIFGQNGNDKLYGGGGDDLILGGADNDYINGQFGNDRLWGNYGNDFISGGVGNDNLNGCAGNDVLKGENGGDYLYGGNGNDFMDGGADSDVIFGGFGNDAIWGSRGADRMTGGPGLDRFVFLEGDTGIHPSSRDSIIDFQKMDRIDFRQMDANVENIENDAFLFSGQNADANSIWYEKVGSNTLIYGDSTGDSRADFSILLISSHDLTVSDFLF